MNFYFVLLRFEVHWLGLKQWSLRLNTPWSNFCQPGFRQSLQTKSTGIKAKSIWMEASPRS